MYPAHSREGRGYVVLRHIIFLTFLRIPEALRVEWRNSTPRFVSLLGRGDENIKYFIFSSGDRNHKQSRLQSLTSVPAPRMASEVLLIY